MAREQRLIQVGALPSMWDGRVQVLGWEILVSHTEGLEQPDQQVMSFHFALCHVISR